MTDYIPGNRSEGLFNKENTAVIKKFFKYLLSGISALLVISLVVISVFFIRYKINVGKETGLLKVIAKPGKTGQWVDPFIGTGGFPPYTSADDVPGVTLPFGMVKLSPDTKYFLDLNPDGTRIVSTAGYYYGDNRIIGFSHTRMTGTGAFEGGHFRVIPATGENAMKNYRNGHFSRFSHKNEIAFPGFYERCCSPYSDRCFKHTWPGQNKGWKGFH
jgi:putative alpha-1,2-mannosidase